MVVSRCLLCVMRKSMHSRKLPTRRGSTLSLTENIILCDADHLFMYEDWISFISVHEIINRAFPVVMSGAVDGFRRAERCDMIFELLMMTVPEVNVSFHSVGVIGGKVLVWVWAARRSFLRASKPYPSFLRNCYLYPSFLRSSSRSSHSSCWMVLSRCFRRDVCQSVHLFALPFSFFLFHRVALLCIWHMLCLSSFHNRLY